MRRISAFVLSTISVVVLLFSYSTSTAGPLAASTPPAAESGTTAGSTGSAGSTSTSGGSSSGSTAGSSTVTGQVASTRWGPVQVEVTVADGRLTGVQVLQQPSGNPQDEEINAYALPILTQESVAAQSADIDMVSGATVTSEGYVASLQSALDQAGL